ncbi:MAG TPA: DUF177 domain-containing protein [Bacteroidia bacterium]|nr:DUF177 domain-containing protein [Bacteroidia bacterium]HWY98816.1 DUF177 domain-containing protein [Bacteroidia bacterium]
MRIKDTQCIISLAPLKNGEHSFLFTIDGELFRENHFDDIHEADLKVIITFNKNSSILMFNFNIEGTVNVTCDRCGDDFNQSLKLERQLIVKTDTKQHEEEDEMVSLTSAESDIDIAPFIYQYVALTLPMQRVHPTKEGKSLCNTEIIDKLKRLEVKESNEEQYITNSNKRSSHSDKSTNN